MRKLLWFILLPLLFLALLFIFLFPVEHSKSISVAYTIQKSGEQLNNVPSLKKWFIPFAGNPQTQLIDENKLQGMKVGDYKLILEDIRYSSSLLKFQKNDQSLQCLLSAEVDTAENYGTLINLYYKTTYWQQWFSKAGLIETLHQSFDNLKEYMFDTKAFYGYLIERDKVVDTSVLFKKVTVPLDQKRAATKKVFEELIKYAELKDAGYNGTRMIYTITSNNEINLFIGIGVTKFVENDTKADIIYKRMPYQKNMLVATYQGAYGDVGKAYNALEEFRKDYSLTNMAIPYQKILSDGYDFADDQIVQMKIYFPIY